MLALGDNELPQTIPVQLHALKLEHDWLANDSLFFCVAHGREEWMLQALLQGDAIVGVEDENFFQEVDGLGRRARVFLLKVCSRISWELLEVLECL